MSDLTFDADIWSRILRDCHCLGEARLQLRRDDNSIEDEPGFPAAYFEPVGEGEAEVLSPLQGRILDVGCGPGRHVLFLQERGVDVVGIDVAPGAIEVAQERGCRDVCLMDALALDFEDGSFDGAILFGNNLGMTGTVETTVRMLRELRRVVRPGGQLRANGHDPLITDEPRHLRYHERNRARGRPPGQVTIRFEYEGCCGPWFDWLLFERERAAEVLQQTGWQPVEWLGDAEGPVYYVVATLK